jgi:hypothetical protein
MKLQKECERRRRNLLRNETNFHSNAYATVMLIMLHLQMVLKWKETSVIKFSSEDEFLTQHKSREMMKIFPIFRMKNFSWKLISLEWCEFICHDFFLHLQLIYISRVVSFVRWTRDWNWLNQFLCGKHAKRWKTRLEFRNFLFYFFHFHRQCYIPPRNEAQI